jgi:hypothetical protein
MAEGGTNTLFLALGFLRWKRRNEDKDSYRAPLLLVPVKLLRQSAQSTFRLAHHEDEVHFNATLLQLLQQDFAIKIPALAGDLPQDHSGIDVAGIYALVRAAVRDVPGFEVVEEAAIGTFSFAKYLMWKDLVDRTDSLRQNRLVRHLVDSPDQPFESVGGPSGTFPQPRDLDRRFAPRDLLTPLPADSSQLAAIVAAADGHDFVIIGPPGTGKSQTIANMVAHCLAQGKSVLFVAEKAAALDVVYRRLRQHGLGDVCLELHSNKTDRRHVIQQLGEAWDRASASSNREWIQVTDGLQLHRDQLNAYVEALHRPGSHGFSVFEAIGIALQQKPAFRLAFAAHDSHDPESFTALAALAERLARAYAQVAGCQGLSWITAENWSFAWQSVLIERMTALQQAADTLRATAKPLIGAFGLGADPDLMLETVDLLSRVAAAIAAR